MKKTGLKLLSIVVSLLLLSATGLQAQYNTIVAKDGSGDYSTLQAAISAAPSNLTAPYKIFVKKGKYVEKVTIPANKPFIQIFGEGVNETIFSWDDYAGKAGVTEIATITIFSDDCLFMNMTIENSWGRKYDGPQALAVRANGDRIIFKNCKLVSGQDTVMAKWNGKRQYFRNCYFDGNTDYIYGSAIAIFDSCVIFNRDRVDGSNGGVFTAASTPPGQTYGYVFRDCLLPNNNGQSTYTLGRPWGNSELPHTSETKVVFLNCRMGTTVRPERWQVWSATTNTSLITYAEYKTKYFNGTLVNLSNRLSWTKDFSDAEAAPYFVNSNIFGAWNPCAVLTEVCQPFSAPISTSNFRVNRSSSQSTILFNICWPISGVNYNLHRSVDSVNFSSIQSFTSATDTTAAFQFTDVLPPSGTTYFYKLVASKTGYQTYTADTILKVNISIPLNGDYRSSSSGGWTNNVSAISTISSGVVTGVNITSSPSGYTTAPTVTFATAPAGGTTATGTAILTNGVVTGVNILNPGAGYTSAPSVTFSTAGTGASSIWQRYNSSNSTWEPVALGTSPSNANVTIASGTTVSLNNLVGISGLTIENGAVLQTDGQARNIRMNGDINNNGTFGGSNTITNRLTMEMSTSNGTFTIGGLGVYNFVTFRPLTAVQNSNYIIASNMTLSGGLQACYNSTTATDQGNNNVTLTINPGVTVVASYLHNNTTTNTAASYGNYTYNINGILDLSNSTTLTGLIPHATATTKTLAVNVSGLLKLGTQFRMVSTSPGASEGKVVVTINNGAEIDATKTNTTFVTAPNYIVTAGTGMLTRAVAAAPINFPVGTSPTSYSPVTLTNNGTPDNFSVAVKNSFDYPVTDASKVVNKQWNIQESVPGGSNTTVELSWLTTDQASSFSPSQPVSIIHYNGTIWEQFPATVSGSGTMANPYVATATGITSFSPFGVQNVQGPLPLNFLSFNAKANERSNTVDLTWATTNELSTKEFIVERSIDNNIFKTIGKVVSKNAVGINQYNFTDASPVKAANYYRLKQVDNDGVFKYSSVVFATLKSAVKLSGYPNPAINRLKVNYPVANNAQLKIVGSNGNVLQTHSLPANSVSKELNLAGLASGTYLLIYQTEDKTETVKFVKK